MNTHPAYTFPWTFEQSYCGVAADHPFHGPYHDTQYGFPLPSDDGDVHC